MADANHSYDLIVVGGGVYGLMVALEATRRDLRPLLLEKGEIAGATSANSLRILHGGLRYLDSLDLVRSLESIRERAWWMHHFPEYTRPLACLMPLYGDGLRRPAFLRLALAVNDVLCRYQGSTELPPGRVIDAYEVRTLCPAVETLGLRGGAVWYDAFAPDMARLLGEVLRWTRDEGAVVLDHVEAIGALVSDGRIVGVRARDLRRGRENVFRADVVINAAGHWSASVAAAFGGRAPLPVRPLLSWNVAFDRAPLSDHAIAVRARQAGAQTYFLVPLDGRLGVGTGYAPWSGDPGDVAVPQIELERFVAAVNAALPGLDLAPHEVAQVFAGVLPAAGGALPSDRPVLFDHGASGGPAGLYSVNGVKLTTARAVAERLLERALPGARPRPASAFQRPPAAVSLTR